MTSLVHHATKLSQSSLTKARSMQFHKQIAAPCEQTAQAASTYRGTSENDWANASRAKTVRD